MKTKNIFLLYGLTDAKQPLTKQEVNTETFKCHFYFEGWHHFNSLRLFKN